MVAATLMLTSVAQAAPKWITVSKADCIDNGGEMRDGVCSANWQDAGGICSAIGATLPTIGQLKGVITNCGGVVDDYHNEENQAYQSCYKKSGFISNTLAKISLLSHLQRAMNSPKIGNLSGNLLN